MTRLPRLKTRRHHRRAGSPAFILMEVLVSVAILAVGVTLLLESIISSLDANRLTVEYSHAIFLAESKLWELEQEYAYKLDMDTGERTNFFEPPFQEYTWETDIESDETAVEYQITVKVLWEHRGKEQEYSLVSVVPMRRDERDLI